MAISTRATILQEIEDVLERITTVNGFHQGIKKILRGIRSRQDFNGEFPGLCYWNEEGPRKEGSFGESQRELRMHVWGYVAVDAHANDYSALDYLVADVEKVLMSATHNSKYYERTIIGNTVYYEGGEDDSYGAFDMEFSITYNYEWDEP